jgi:hypothetical protein
MEIKIQQETIDHAANNAFSRLLADDNYHNPIKQILEKEFSWDMNGAGKTELAKQFKLKVEESISKLIDSPDFHQLLGEKIATKFAEAAVKDLRTIKDRKM